MAIQNLAALGRHVNHVELLAVGACGQLGMFDDLQVQEPGFNSDGPDREDGRDRQES
jgi:hypothetical protein